MMADNKDIKNIEAPKFQVGQSVLKPDGKIGKVLGVQYINGVWKYEVSSKAVDIKEQRVIDGVMILTDEEMKLVPGDDDEGND